MSRENGTWGAPRIQAELGLLGYEVAESSVAEYMDRRGRRPPSQSWKAFLHNHLKLTAGCDFFVVPTATCGFRRVVKGIGLREILTAPQSPWQNPYVERVIGSIRRECLDHLISLSENHLRRILTEYVRYYNTSRAHMALDGNSPVPRQVDPPSSGEVIAEPVLGGLHHRYRRAA